MQDMHEKTLAMNDRFLRLPGQKWLGRRIVSSIELVELNRYTCDIQFGDAGANVFSAGEGYVNSSHQSMHGRMQSSVSFPVLRSGDGMTTKTNSEHCFTQDVLTQTCVQARRAASGQTTQLRGMQMSVTTTFTSFRRIELSPIYQGDKHKMTLNNLTSFSESISQVDN